MVAEQDYLYETVMWNKTYINKIWERDEKIIHIISFLIYLLIKKQVIKQNELNKMESELKMSEIDWTKFESKYLKLEEQEPVDVELTEWKEVEKEFQGQKKTMIEFRVISENSRQVDKILSASTLLIRELQPLIEKAEVAGKKTIKSRINRIGSGKNTRYSVKAL